MECFGKKNCTVFTLLHRAAQDMFGVQNFATMRQMLQGALDDNSGLNSLAVTVVVFRMQYDVLWALKMAQTSPPQPPPSSQTASLVWLVKTYPIV